MDNRPKSFEYEDLLRCGRGELFPEGPQLPLPPMLMFDRISEISETGGPNGKGFIRAELELKPDLWFFPCHFKGDPVMPGCLGLDALWQMLGFFLGWLGSPGKGRALGMGEVKFSGQVLPTMKKVIYGIDLKRVMRSKLVLGIADGWLEADGSVIYRALDFLMAHGLVHRLESLNAYVGCPQPERSHRGRFLICDGCGHVAEFDSPALRTAIADQADHQGFAVRDETVEVRGLCRRCQLATAAAS